MAPDGPMSPPPPDQPEPQDPGTDDAGQGPTVLATILDNGDGTYQLVKGDEDEGMDEGGEGGDANAKPGQTYGSTGELLKGVLDLCKEADGTSDGMAQENFDAGFEGRKPKDMKAPPPKAMA